jgi:hypothetical protein
MATVWITYAWADNTHGDVDFIGQELARSGVAVKLDRWNIGAGRRLWEQIERFIGSPAESDAWMLVATTNSLSSEACKEEFAYALDRALKARGEGYPIIGLFLGPTEPTLIPAGIRTRLYVSIADPDWKERVVAAAEGRSHELLRPQIEPYYLKVHQRDMGEFKFAIEVRPRAGVWAPFIAAIPANDKERVSPTIMIGPRDIPTVAGMLVNTGSELSKDGTHWLLVAGNQSTPTESYYVWCKELPSRLIFGVNGGAPQYTTMLGAGAA